MIGDHDFHLALAYGVSAVVVAAELALLWRRTKHAARSDAALHARRHEQPSADSPADVINRSTGAASAASPIMSADRSLP